MMPGRRRKGDDKISPQSTYDRLMMHQEQIRCLCGKSTSNGQNLELWWIYPGKFVILKGQNAIMNTNIMKVAAEKFDFLRDDYHNKEE